MEITQPGASGGPEGNGIGHMPGVFDDHVLPVSCAKCGAKLQKTVSWLRENDEIMCPCGTTMRLNTGEVMAAVEALDDALSRIVRPASEGASPAA